MFRRQNRNLLLTDVGQAYLPPLSQAFSGIDAATQRLAPRDHLGILNVSVLGGFPAKWLVPLLGHFTDSHPGITVRISAEDSAIDFSQMDVDLALRYCRAPADNLHAEQFLTKEIFVVCSPDLLTSHTPINSPENLFHHTPLHYQIREDWQMCLEPAGVQVEAR